MESIEDCFSVARSVNGMIESVTFLGHGKRRELPIL